MTQVLPLKPLSSYERIEDENAVGAYLSKLFCYHTNRNAWHGNPSGEVRGFGTSFSELTTKCEQERTQGTTFYIDEVPALAILGKSHSLVIAVRGNAPFKDATHISFTGRSVQQIKDEILAPFKWTYLTDQFLVPNSALPPATFPFNYYWAQPQGAGKRLRWYRNTTSPPDIEHALLVLSRICMHLNATG
ncbi:hypothetical protein [Thermomonas carbonis]|jgi:hypothetical protein|uniref:Uncharacterized protein n=1 Tax=Thermomonas carbonis TaxID=1463158 RepID=A0A7G9SNK8_9GAMM|nr:hypothetical protein [Thermomonas carbonis]QNN69433.1 hypothetical protein H9L16_12210 [Thermomonas carbonis]